MQIFQSLSSQNWWPLLPYLLLIASLLIFLISWLHEPRRLINGVLFTVCLFCLGGWLALPIPSILIYLSLTAYNFLINLLPYQFVPRHYQQVQLGRPMPKFIMSGGQGPDEQLSEAAAMKNYAAEHGISQEMILLEDQSTNTLQNMKFSKTVAEKDFGSNHFKAAFFSSNFHILRAGLLARQVNLQANGIGARTRFYYLPNAIIREIAAVFVMNKKLHLTVIILLSVLIFGEAILSSLGIHLF